MSNNDQHNYEEEAQVGNSPISLSFEQMELALSQMKNSICKIKKENNIFGTGFFCKIPFPNSFTLLPVLITCEHVLNKHDVSQGKKINFSLNNEKIQSSILISNSRRTYINKKNDVTIIEIKPEKDNIKYDSFLDIDEYIYKNNPNEIYKEKSVYILHYENGKNMKYSIGIIKSISEDDYNIYHLCTTGTGSSGGPIINLFNYKVMGIHKGNKNSKINLGTYIRIVIDEFNKGKKIENLENYEEKEKNIIIEEKEKEKLKENKNYKKEEEIERKILSLINGRLPNIKSIPSGSKIEEKFNNIIYYDENINDLNLLYQRSDYFERNTNGAFILCKNIESFVLIRNEILKVNLKDNIIIFNLIVSGNDWEKVIKFLKENKNFEDCIKNICIYSNNINKYSSLNEIYNNISGIYDNEQDIVNNFINKYSSSKIKPFPLIKLYNYGDYLEKYKNIHLRIALFYGDLTSESYKINIEKMIQLIEEELESNELIKDKNKILEGFKAFDLSKHDFENLDKIIIREYTNYNFSEDLNKWLRNIKINSNDSIMYFTSRLMFSLNSFAIKDQKYLVEKNKECYRGIKLPYTYLLQYERAKGKIIFYPNFLPTSRNRKLAEKFAKRYKSLELYETNLKFSVLYIITNIYNENWVSNGIEISSVSRYRDEEEIVFQPFSFFHVKDVEIDIKKYKADIYLETIGKTEILEERIKYGKKIEYNKELNIMQIK